MAIMPFVGDDSSVSAQLQGEVNGEINTLAGFLPQPFLPEQLPNSLTFRPDEPPDPSILGDSPLALTGEYYLDDEAMRHFQLWLWNSSEGSLVYTDEMVFENMEEAESYLPSLVSWVFSKVASPQGIPLEPEGEIAAEEGVAEESAAGESAAGETAAEELRVPEKSAVARGPGFFPAPWLYVGLWGGAALNSSGVRATGTYDSGAIQSFGATAAFSMELRIRSFLSVQAEAAFSVDSLRPFMIMYQGDQEIRTSDLYMTSSIQVPFLIKISLVMGKWRPAVAFGPYFILLLSPVWNKGESYAARIDLPIGVAWNIDLGYSLGPGELFFDLRYERNIGMNIVRATTFQYHQSRILMSLGYRFALGNRRRSR